MTVRNDPVITRIIYEVAQLRVWWTPSADTGVIGYVIQLTYVGEKPGEIAYQSDLIKGQASGYGILGLTERLNIDLTYLVTVQAMWSSGPSEASVAVALPTELPALQSAWYDEADIHFQWTPSPQAALGYQLVVYSDDSGVTYSYDVPDPSATSAVMPASTLGQGLDPAQHWLAAVAAKGEKNTSSRCPAAAFLCPLPALALAPSTLYQAGRGINACWTAVNDPQVTGYRLSLTSPQDDTNLWIDILNPTATSGVLPITTPLAENRDYELRLIALTATRVGVASRLSRVVTTIPVLTSAVYDGTKVTMNWGPVFNLLITGYTLQVLSLSSGVSYTSDVAGYDAVTGTVTIATPLDPNQAWVARVIAKGPISAQSADVPLQVQSPSINTVRCDGSSVAAEWGALTKSPEQYVLALFSDSNQIAVATSTGNAATVAIPEGTTAPSVRVAAKRAIAIGPWSASAAVITGVPRISKMATNAVTGAASLTWSSVTGATSYLLSFSNGATDSASSAQYNFPTPPAPLSDISVKVAARSVVTAGAVTTTSTGPLSSCFELATGQPKLVSAQFDGLNVTTCWTRVAGATGYRISIQQTDGGAAEVASFDANGSAESATFPFTPPDPAHVYVAGVQACFSDTGQVSNGPLSLTLPLFQPGFFASSAAQSVTYPNLYPATSLATVLAAQPSESIALYLPQIGGATPLKGLPLTQGAFDLEENTDPPSKAIYPYVLKFAPDSDAWKFTTEPVRAGLKSDYVTFLKNAEQTAGVFPWGIVLLQQVISRYMPQTFQETLYYGFGLNFPGEGAATASFDLRPGMVLRVVPDPYQALTESSTLRWSTGYLGGVVQDYDVGGFIDSTGAWNVGYDNCIGQLVTGGALTVSPPPFNAPTQQEGGVADAADLYFPGFRTPFYRLFVPTTLATPSAACPTDTPKSFVLAAAPTYAALTTTVNTPGEACPVAYFRGRAVVRVCLRVRLDNAELVVPAGTTVGNLLERAGRLPSPSPAPLNGLVMERALGPVVLDPAAPVSSSSSYRVRLDWKTQPIYAPGWNALSLPLLPGDCIYTRR